MAWRMSGLIRVDPCEARRNNLTLGTGALAANDLIAAFLGSNSDGL
jgi:hypothetical protein